MTNNRYFTIGASTFLACSLILGAGPAHAGTMQSSGSPVEDGASFGDNTVSAGEFSDAEIDALAADIEKLFTSAMVDDGTGGYYLDEEAVLASFGPDEGNAIIGAVRAQVPAQTGQMQMLRASYGECVLNFTGFGTIFGATEGTIIAYINREQWRQAAETMVRFLGRSAVRGGAVGLAASLAAGGAWCATPWSR